MATDTRAETGVSNASDERGIAAWHRDLRLRCRDPERLLWAVLALALAADVLSTVVGLGRGYTEGNPVVRAALADAGLAGLAALKLGVVLAGVPAWRLLPRPQRGVVPLGLSLPWLGAAAANAWTLL